MYYFVMRCLKYAPGSCQLAHGLPLCLCVWHALRRDSAAMYAGIWLMFIGSLCLLVNFACQFAHTSREREYIRRLTYKQFIGI